MNDPSLQPVRADVDGLPPMYGALVLSVNGDLPPRLQLNARAARVQLSAEYNYPLADIVHEADGSITASFTAASGSAWVFDNRGSMVIGGSEAGAAEGVFFIRSFDYRLTPEGVVSMGLSAVSEDRLGRDGAILPGEDLVVVASGRLIGYCTALEGGSVIDDPGHVLNPRCDEILGPP